MGQRSEQKFVQDTMHIGTKLRNRILKSSIVLPLGNKQISQSHLKLLIKTVSKTTHGLILNDVDPKDRQNFSSYEKITSERVRNALTKYIVDSEGTVAYLEKCQQVTSCFLQYDLAPLERIYRIYNTVFFFRLWWTWMKSSNAYKLSDNFITPNCHKSIEVNATNLVNLIKQFRDEEADEMFLPTLFDSQSCEKMFRHFRSMGTANFTKINFSMFEVLNMIRRVEIKNEIEQFKLSDFEFVFPRTKHVIKTKSYTLPSDEEIEETLNLAKTHAIEQAEKFGLIKETISNAEYQLKAPKFNFEDVGGESDDDFDLIDLRGDDCTDSITSQFVNVCSIPKQCEKSDNDSNIYVNKLDDCMNSNDDLSSDVDELSGNSPYTLISDGRGGLSRIRKSTLVWALSAPTQRLSNDRLSRVQIRALKDISVPGTSHHRTFRKSGDIVLQRENVEFSESYVQRLDLMNIGDWCFFRGKRHERILIGAVLRFQFAGRKREKEKHYANDSVSFSGLEKSIETLCTFYFLDEDGNWNSFPNNHFDLNIDNYIATLVGISPKVEHTKLLFETVDSKILRTDLKQFL